MSTINISLSGALKLFVEEQVAGRGYATSSEYVCDLIRKDQERKRLRRLLEDGASSPATASADDAFFSDLRNRIGRQETR